MLEPCSEQHTLWDGTPFKIFNLHPIYLVGEILKGVSINHPYGRGPKNFHWGFSILKVTVQSGKYGVGLSNTRAWGSLHLFWLVQGSLRAPSISNFTLEMPPHAPFRYQAITTGRAGSKAEQPNHHMGPRLTPSRKKRDPGPPSVPSFPLPLSPNYLRQVIPGKKAITANTHVYNFVLNTQVH